MIANAFKNCLGLALGSGYKLALLDSLSAATTEAPKADNKAKDVKKAKEPEPEPEEEEDVGFGDLF
jgi:ribosomal protein L12E/L44/L45/RPP1/RPP2